MCDTVFSSIEEAVLCFYQSSHPKRSEAHELLTKLQKSPEIWRIVWDDMLLSKSTEVQFYGAAVLHSKFLNDWEQIPLDQYDVLKSKLFEAILYFKDGSKTVQNRLCIVLGTYAIRMTPARWPNAISYIIATFQPQNVPNVPEDILAGIILDILCVIPEQFQTMVLSKNEKILIRNAIQNEALNVLNFLESTLLVQNLEVISQSLKCTKSWLEFGLPVEDCVRLLEILMNIVVVTYSNSDTSKYSVSALEAISILFNHPSNEKYEKTITKFLRMVLKLSNLLKQENNEVINADFIPCLCSLFVEIGDSQMKLLIKLLKTEDRDITMEILKIMLHCSNAPGSYPVDEIYSVQTFNFWYLLEDELVNVNYNDDSVMQIVKPFFSLLVPILLQKSMFPENLNEWSKQDSESFRCYRQDVADTYMYVYVVIESDLLDTLVNGMKYAAYETGSSISNRWRQIEAYLHAFHAISYNLVSSDYKQVAGFIAMVFNLPFPQLNPRVTLTAMDVIGAYAEWYCNNVDVLGTALKFTLEGILNKQVSSAATVALKDLALHCQPVIYPFAMETLLTCEKALEKKQFDHSEELRVIFTIGKILTVLPHETICQHLQLVAMPYIEQIRTMLLNKESLHKHKLSHYMNVFTQLFLSLEMDCEHSAVYFLTETLLPIYKEILTHKDSKLQTTACISLRAAVNNLGQHCGELVPVITDLLINVYHQCPEKCFLEVVKQVLLFYGNKEMHFQLMSNLVRELCSRTMEILGTNSDGNISEHTALIDSFYGFATDVVKKYTGLIVNTPAIDIVSMFRYASVALCLQETLAVKSASHFLINVIFISRANDSFLSLVQSHGAELVYQIILAIGKVSPRTCLELVTDVLIALNKKYCDWLSRWLQEVLAPVDFPSHRLTDDMKKHFIKTILRERGNKRKVQEVSREFAFLCRGLINKECQTQRIRLH